MSDIPENQPEDQLPAAPEAVEPTPEGASAASGAVAGEGADKAAEPTVADTKAKLASLFPALFRGEPKPLKLRIQADIQERAPGAFTKQVLAAFLRRHTGTTSYLVAASKAKQRFDLDGNPAGEFSEEHRKVALEELARRRGNQQAKREEEEAGRRERAALLRGFETTKLTVANFCALKGIAPDQLDAVLAQAREEAKEDASRPRRPDQRGDGRGDRRDGAPRGPRGDGPRQARGGRGDGRGPRGDGRGRPQGERRGEGPSGRGPRPDRQARPEAKPAAETGAPTTAPPVTPTQGDSEG